MVTENIHESLNEHFEDNSLRFNDTELYVAYLFLWESWEYPFYIISRQITAGAYQYGLSVIICYNKHIKWRQWQIYSMR